MIKHRWRELAKSFGDHVDPDKTEQLKRTKSDIENNVTRIFKLIKSEDLGKKDGNRRDSKNESELVGLIENFYQQYQSLYALYDHLIGESGRIVRRRKVRTGSSPLSPSSSGSDSEYFSSDEIDNNNVKPENHEHQKMADSGNHDLKTENLGLKQLSLSRSSSEGKDAINTEYLAALQKVHADITNEDRRNEVDERVKELSALVEAHEHHGPQSSARVKELEAQLAGFKTDLESFCSQKRDLEAWKEDRVAEAKQLGDKNIGLHARILELELVLKEKNDEISDLVKKLENESSSTPKVAYLMAQTSNLQLEVESLHAQKGEMEERMATVKTESSDQVEELTDKINAMKQELETLRWERAETGVQLDRKNKEISQELHQIETLKEELKRKDVAEKKISEERQRFLKQVKDMELEVDSLRSHKKNLEKQKRSKMHEADKLRRESEGLRAKIVNLEKTLSQRGEEVSALRKECEDGKNEASTQLMTLTTEVSSLKQELDSVKLQKSQLELQCEKENKEWLKRLTEMENETEKKMLEERQRFLDQIKDMEREVDSLCSQKTNLKNQITSKIHDTDMLQRENEGLNARIFELEKTLTERGDEVEALHRECEDGHKEAANKLMALTTQVSDLKQELDTLTKKSQMELQSETENKEYKERQTQMEGKIADQQRVIKEQEDTIKKITKEYKNAKMWFPESKLNLQLAERKMEELAKKHRVQFEDNVRLLYQRIRVAEHIHNDTKESYWRMKEECEKETREIREKLAFYENPLKKMKEVSETAKRTLNRLDRVACRFDKEHSNFLNNISRMSDEVQVAKSWVTGATDEIKRLKRHADCLATQLDEKEEQESLLREKVWKLEAMASKEAGEKLNLMKNFSQLEKQVAKMEKTIKERDEDLLSLGEEKREVIRQLCILIDHHRIRYDDLKEVITKRPGRSSTVN
ncbi:putative transcription factor bZIP family [Rosa chinensis]|uniref:Putative transcription factor bZIP family n=1 Tax=Rosa chinensis TaxID=74649 RepID=A0A2P6P6D3_ROSCH|nr:COP1-interactive protein 1 [Rosa chinensis]XP_040366460.1 COP1-interactive protein 1 [Rosa chinensis]PRQ17479.1 putative transcription factor bZIP family [Rosa chinensis]